MPTTPIGAGVGAAVKGIGELPGYKAKSRPRNAPSWVTESSPEEFSRRMQNIRGKNAPTGGGPPPSSGKSAGGGRRLPNFGVNLNLPSRKLPKLPKTESSGAHGLIVAEFILCVALIGSTPILMRKPQDGKLYVPNDFVRLSSVCLLFFILALTAQSEKGAKLSAAFGGLVTLGVLYNSAGAIKVISKVFINAGTKGGNVPTPEPGDNPVTVPTYNPLDPFTGQPQNTHLLAGVGGGVDQFVQQYAKEAGK